MAIFHSYLKLPLYLAMYMYIYIFAALHASLPHAAQETFCRCTFSTTKKMPEVRDFASMHWLAIPSVTGTSHVASEAPQIKGQG